MAKIMWDHHSIDDGPGLSHGLLFLAGRPVPWNGLVALDEQETGSITEVLYFDGDAHMFTQNTGEYAAEVRAVTYPRELEEYEGGRFSAQNQSPRLFDFSYQSGVDGDTQIHLIYNALIETSDKAWKTTTPAAGLEPFVWSLRARPTVLKGVKPASHLIVSVADSHPDAISRLRDTLYGTVEEDATMPGMADVLSLFEDYSVFKVTQNGDGTYTVEGPDDMVQNHADGTFTVVSPTVRYLDSGTYTVSSM